MMSLLNCDPTDPVVSEIQKICFIKKSPIFTILENHPMEPGILNYVNILHVWQIVCKQDDNRSLQDDNRSMSDDNRNM